MTTPPEDPQQHRTDRDALETARQIQLTRVRDVLENTRQAQLTRVRDVLDRGAESLAVDRESGVPEGLRLPLDYEAFHAVDRTEFMKFAFVPLREDVPEDVPPEPLYAPSSFEAFYARNVGRCTKYVSSRRGRGWWNLPGHSPEDITQDAFVTVLRNWDKVSVMAYPYAYLRRVADNLLRRAFEQGWEYPVEEFGDLESWDRTAEHEQGLDAVIVNGETFRELVGQLPERQAQVLVLYALEFTDSGIGELLGLAPATVRSHRRHLVNYVTRTGWREPEEEIAAA
ncbi:RNA polymerase sigma factor [Streptomyces sp. NBC_00989]|uniref:RNA polymerase sigma factor n=1 Tax=Streptomyces sp. NBC_00989 TaxID=2903705 RepID=UPI00386FB95F|nr:sigma-70 family RNA polymerase sigma factor [Streptomyces sp. NBC_00989]WSW98158.1 sigma-70 family RNA polymerase sigma factor [Streptomyces sp. NBC_00989]